MLIAQMVARNESNRYLQVVLERLNQIVDLIAFTDDASDDATPDIASNMGAKVYKLTEPMFSRNEGILRTLAWEHLSSFATPGDWILAVDADEILWPGHQFSVLLDQNRFDVLGVEFYHMWNATHFRVDKAWTPNIGSRLFRYRQGGEFIQRKLACGSEPTYVQEMIQQGRALWNTGIKMQHLGYVQDVDKIAKYERYMNLDGGDYHSRTHIESIVDANPALLPWRE